MYKDQAPEWPVDATKQARTFDTGATRDTDEGKLDYEAFLSPLVLERYAQYMHKNRVQSDGKVREGDNWQKGMPQYVYMKSAWRHFMDWWCLHRRNTPLTPEGQNRLEDALCALLFNVQGYLLEQLKKRKGNADRSDKKPLATGVSNKHSGGDWHRLRHTARDIPPVRDSD